MRKMFCGLFVWIFVVAVAAAAPGGSVRCGKLLDVRTGQLLMDQIVAYDGDGVITSVAPAGSGNTAAIDLSKAVCLPGLIDMHTHITGEPSDSGYGGDCVSFPPLPATPPSHNTLASASRRTPPT